MKRLRDAHGYQKTSNSLRFLKQRLASREETRERATALDAQLKDIDARYTLWRDARDARMAATAEADYRDERLGDAVMRLSRHILADVGGDRTAPRYRRLFPSAPSATLQQGVEEQTRAIDAMLLLAGDDHYQNHAPHFEQIAEAQAALTAALETRRDLYSPEQRARVELEIGLERARRAYNLSYPTLQLLFPDDEALVESFFLR